MAFLVFSRWILRWSRPAELFHAQLKARKIARRRWMPLELHRRLRWSGDELIVSDRIRALPGCRPLRWLAPVDDVDVHSPSARMMASVPGDRIGVETTTAVAWADRLNTTGILHLETRYAADAKGRLRFTSIETQVEC